MTNEEVISPENLSNEDLGKALEESKNDSEPIEDEVINDDGEVINPDQPEDGETQPEEPEPGNTPAPSETLEDRLAKLEKRIKDKDAFIEERNAEIGRLRKLVPDETKKKLHEVSSETFFEDPIGSVEKIAENKKIREEQERELRENLLREEIGKRREILKGIAPDFEGNIDLIAEELKKDGFNEEGVKAYKSNPFAYEPALLHNLNIRAKQSKRIAELEAKVKQLEGNPKRILDKVEIISRQRPKISGKATGGQVSDEIDIDRLDARSISKLSDKQLKELLEKTRKK